MERFLWVKENDKEMGPRQGLGFEPRNPYPTAWEVGSSPRPSSGGLFGGEDGWGVSL